MKMSDKEFDRLFSDKLNDLDIEPSAGLWAEITPQIPGGSKTRSGLGPMLSIAATLVILLTAGLLFMPGTQKIALHGTYNPRQSVNDAIAAIKREPVANIDTDVIDDRSVAIQPKAAGPVGQLTTNKIEGGLTTTITNPVDTIQSMVRVSQIKVTRPEQQDNNIIKPIPAADIIATVPPKTDQSVNTKRTIAMANETTAKKGSPTKRKRIHTLGDLLNVVIAKVDKRDNKIIQFSNDDDDDAFSVSGVNLGPIKVKRQN